MNSLKQRWEKFRSQAQSNLVRSNSFTLQLSPSFFKDARAARLPSTNSSNNNSQKTANSLTALSCSSEKRRSSCVFPTTVQHSQQKVRYIFGITLRRRPSCLQMLQEPLRDVYLAYMTKNSSVPGIIDISPNGFKLQYARYDGTDIEEFKNSFQSIAYWAAVQCVVKAHTQNGQSGIHIGFFPFSENGQWLVQGRGQPDDDSSSKSIFMFLAGEEQHLSLIQTEHPPLFACVMRHRASRSLRCHVFICSGSQQAIALASTLYDIAKTNLRQLGTNSFKRSKHVYNGKNSVKSQKTAYINKKDSRHALMDNETRSAINGACRSSSFSLLMTGLQHLAIKDLVPGPGGSQRHRTKKLFKQPRPHHCSSPQLANCKASKSPCQQNDKHTHQYKEPINATVVSCTETNKKPSEKSNGKSRSKFTRALDRSHQNFGQTVTSHDSNWKYQALRHRHSPLPPTPPPRPRWMKLLKNISLGHANRGKIMSVFNLSKMQKHRSSLRPLTSNQAQMAVVLASKGQWLKRGSDRSAVPLLTCTCNQDLKLETRKSLIQNETSNERNSHCPIGPRSSSSDSGYVPMERSVPKKPEDAYIELQEAGQSRTKRKLKTPEQFSVSENNLFNKQMLFAAVPCSIGLDAALDDDSDSLDSSRTMQPAPHIKGGVVSPEKMCPHMANPQIFFRKLLPGGVTSYSKRKYGWNITKTCITPKSYDSKTSRGAAKHESSLRKKDAELVSILEQIANKENAQTNTSTNRITDQITSIDFNGKNSINEKLEESNSWGWATYLP